MHHIVDEIAGLRPALLRAARVRVRNPDWAEDAVSEALVAALEGAASYDGRVPLLQWATGILRHKVVDQVRRHARDCSIVDPVDGDTVDIADRQAADWGDPQQGLMQRQFLRQFERCLQKLPARQGRAFLLRNWLGEETEAICSELGVSAGHLHVMLHRARNGLRAALLAHGAA